MASLQTYLEENKVPSNVISRLITMLGDIDAIDEDIRAWIDIIKLEEVSLAIAEFAEDQKRIYASILAENKNEAKQLDQSEIGLAFVKKIMTALNRKLMIVGKEIRLYDETGTYNVLSKTDKKSMLSLKEIIRLLAGNKIAGRKIVSTIPVNQIKNIIEPRLEALNKDDDNTYISFNGGYIAHGKVHSLAWNSKENITKYPEFGYVVPKYQLAHGSADKIDTKKFNFENAPDVVRRKTLHLANGDVKTAERIECILAVNLIDDPSFLQMHSKEFLNIWGESNAGKSAMFELLSNAADGINSKSNSKLIKFSTLDDFDGFELHEIMKAGWILAIDELPDVQLDARIEAKLKQLTSHTPMRTKQKNVQEFEQSRFAALIAMMSNYPMRKSSKDDILFGRSRVIHVEAAADKTDDWIYKTRQESELENVMNYFLTLAKSISEDSSKVLRDTEQMQSNKEFVQFRDNSVLQFVEAFEKENIAGTDVAILKYQYEEFCEENDVTKLYKQFSSVLESIGFVRKQYRPELEDFEKLIEFAEITNDKKLKQIENAYRAKQRLESSSQLANDKTLIRKVIRTQWGLRED